MVPIEESSDIFLRVFILWTFIWYIILSFYTGFSAYKSIIIAPEKEDTWTTRLAAFFIGFIFWPLIVIYYVRKSVVGK